MNKNELISKIENMVTPIVENLGYELYHVEFVKEEGEYYLRIYIDIETGISFNDCEKVSRVISDLLDEVDPIQYSYSLEVSSPGINRVLYKDSHILKSFGKTVEVGLTKSLNSKRVLQGELIAFNGEALIIKYENNDISIPREIIKLISLKEI